MSYLDDFFDEQSEIIEKFGWAVVHVVPTEDDPPDTVPFAYTVGLTGYGFPELTIAGLPPETGHVLLNEVAGRVCDEGLLLRHGHRLRGLLDGQAVRVVAGRITETLFPGAALMRYGDDRVRLLQLAWPDPAGSFPWQSGYDALDYPQPTIGVPPARVGRCGTFRGIPGAHERRAQRHRAARSGRSRSRFTPPPSPGGEGSNRED
ncbi:hypothetical protein Aph02nite_51940 [Actinoplanes philippinensis]|uniref:DUF4262 domain-containing protein n=1 Tax=Actinoplanes philippinensis TaxID=35752 RepID=UPI000B85FD19|nr:DUF4262 domain-containing protein [Actinoplanes philippinensis]GIE79244.1 hypothetical protein Aph02nite_51940 [Actinoplanes philippinensis]